MGENFKLKWNDHHSIFFSTAESLCVDDHLTDITLSCGKEEFSAHKLVLSVCSSYFKELFTPKSNSKNRPANHAAIIYLKDVNPRHMELLLNFMYRGEINVEEEELMELLSTAKGLQIRGLSESDDEERNSETSSTPKIKPEPTKRSTKAVKRPNILPKESQHPSTSKKIKEEDPPETYVQPEISTEDSNPSENYAADTEILEGQPQFDDEAAEEMVFDQSDMTQQEVSFKINKISSVFPKIYYS